MNWNFNQFAAAGKHALSYVAGALTLAVTWHFLSPSDATGIGDNLNTIYSGVMEIAKGIAGLLAIVTPIYTALRAAHNASPVSQAQSLATSVPGTMVVTTPEIAQAAPSPNVVPNTELKVVAK